MLNTKKKKNISPSNLITSLFIKLILKLDTTTMAL